MSENSLCLCKKEGPCIHEKIGWFSIPQPEFPAPPEEDSEECIPPPPPGPAPVLSASDIPSGYRTPPPPYTVELPSETPKGYIPPYPTHIPVPCRPPESNIFQDILHHQYIIQLSIIHQGTGHHLHDTIQIRNIFQAIFHRHHRLHHCHRTINHERFQESGSVIPQIIQRTIYTEVDRHATTNHLACTINVIINYNKL
ncbi:uncharacterized protein LOC115885047 isoform X2 [Sitophilus oryzae]|uniref:Uncharacterized protein LOC115885047 isoform X2 n=1 Tax=Sitophilus oryzae TaxID=7048 RepID=A0A6J2Y743_SITOR|nr:uncharacterized protein LOC115885047 isoform X2 [Sitophilus oryzae]